MNPNTLQSLNRMLNRIERRKKHPIGRLNFSPIVLAFGLIVAQLLLAWFVPMVWETLLPGGLGQASYFDGWPGLLWRLSILSRGHSTLSYVGIGVVTAVTLGISGRGIFPRLATRFFSLAVILFNVTVVFATLMTSYLATVDAAGFPGL